MGLKVSGIRRRIWGLGSEPRPLHLVTADAKNAILAIYSPFVKVFLSIPDVICQFVTKIVTPSRSGKPMAADICVAKGSWFIVVLARCNLTGFFANCLGEAINKPITPNSTTFLPNDVRSRINKLIAGYLVWPTNKEVNGYLITVWQDCIRERSGSIPARPI